MSGSWKSDGKPMTDAISAEESPIGVNGDLYVTRNQKT